MNLSLSKWLSISLFNLLLVAAIGVTLRYKIEFSLPLVNQKNLLHAHSHFAFSGWITQTLFCLIVDLLRKNGESQAFNRYRIILTLHLFSAYGMLLSFPFLGYAILSIACSTVNIITCYWFALRCFRSLAGLGKPLAAAPWIKAALFFNILSSIGPFALATMMATKQYNSNFYLLSVYFFLHFQYNGWFLFASMGLVSQKLASPGTDQRLWKIIFRCFFIACLPCFLLSVLWLNLPLWLYLLLALAVLLQLSGWAFTLWVNRSRLLTRKAATPTLLRVLFIAVILAFTVKLLLQTASIFPWLSHLAFGFRPIVIAYLHLVLLGVFSLFLLSYIFYYRLVQFSKAGLAGAAVFLFGVVLNEVLLMIQGIAAIRYQGIPYINLGLLLAALFLFSGSLLLWTGQLVKKEKQY